VNLADSYGRRICGEIPTVTVGIWVVVGCFVGYSIYSNKYTDTPNSVGSSVVNAIVIIVLGMIYRLVARILTKWENHKYYSDFENSLVTKNFAFQFVNAYIALFSTAFYK
jgi:hypothetical protein